jgi:hypothetical protein
VAAQSSPGKQQIGQILVAQRWVEPATLARALAEQRHTGKRICSLLIARGLLDPDHAARALANQHNVPGVLQKHLEHRDRALAGLLPAPLARAAIALPIGRTRHHELLICVRDPGPELATALAAAVRGPVVIVVAPAHQLEQLVKQVYDHVPGPPDDDGGVDVDLNTRPIAIIRDLIPMLGDPLDHLGTMTLVGLDDVRVAKDPTQSGHAAVPSRTVAPLPPRTTRAPVIARTTTPRPLHGPSLDATLAAIGNAAAPDDATDAAMWFLAQRFHHAVWFAIDGGVALGERGHGEGLAPEVIQAIAVPLGAPSIVQLAHDTRALATDLPAGTIQDRLTRALGTPRTAAAVPIEIDARVAYVLAVGDASHNPDRAVDELAQLGHALGAAYDRLAGKRI